MARQKKENGLRILVADDEKSIRRFLYLSLSSWGYQVSEAASAGEAVESISGFRPDIVILDLGLPDMDGIEVIKKIREYSGVPIIILSVRDREQDKIEALDRGADDYLTKPFGVDELHARLKAVMRRAVKMENESLLKTGELTIDLGKRLVLVADREIDLSPTEYDILKLLVLNAGKVVTHRRIMKEIWNRDPDRHEGMDHLLRVTISNLRNKIEADPSRPQYIVTEPAIGYRFRLE